MSPKMNKALNSYNNGYKSEVEFASPHRLIQMLFDGALKRIAFAKGAMQRKQIAEKGRFISQAIDIVGGLRSSLDKEQGGEIAANLEALYIYIDGQLLMANLHNSEEILDEVSGLLREVKTSWDSIGTEKAEPAKQNIMKKAEPKAVEPVNNATTRTMGSYATRAVRAYSA